MKDLKVIGVEVFLEKRKTRIPVGILTRENGKLVFTYNKQYFKAKNIISLGPDFPLTQRQFTSEKLFPTLDDRIPSRQNPAYPEYCRLMGIDLEEKDPLILLSTIGRRGPSSFIFYPIYERAITHERLIGFRKSLGLSTREFAAVFELSQATLNALERQRISGHEVWKRLEIILNFPAVALHHLRINGGHLMPEKWSKASKVLKKLL